MSGDRERCVSLKEVENLYRQMVYAAKVYEAKGIMGMNNSTSAVLDLAQRVIEGVDAVLPSQHNPHVQGCLTKYRLYAIATKEHYSVDGAEKTLPPEQSQPIIASYRTDSV